jgi:hypothetical protein
MSDYYSMNALGEYLVFMNATVSAGFIILMVIGIISIIRDNDPLPKVENRQVRRIVVVTWAASALDRSISSLLGGVNAYLITHPDGSPMPAIIVAIARTILAISVWRLVIWIYKQWDRNEAANRQPPHES